MRVYSSDGKYIIDPEDKEQIDHGTYGNIYKLDDETCFKVFKHDDYHKPGPVLVLKEFNLKNFYKIIDLLYDHNLRYKGYIMKTYPKDNFNILSDKDYLLDSVNNMYDGIMVYTKNLFLIEDLHVDNVIVNKDGITIIDVDDYKKFNSDNTSINVYRYKQLLINLINKYLGKYNVIDPMESHLLIKRLIEENKIDLSHFNNTIKRYKRPIDYFGKVIK